MHETQSRSWGTRPSAFPWLRERGRVATQVLNSIRGFPEFNFPIWKAYDCGSTRHYFSSTRMTTCTGWHAQFAHTNAPSTDPKVLKPMTHVSCCFLWAGSMSRSVSLITPTFTSSSTGLGTYSYTPGDTCNIQSDVNNQHTNKLMFTSSKCGQCLLGVSKILLCF